MTNTLKTISKLVFLNSDNVCVHYENDVKIGITTVELGGNSNYYKIEHLSENGDCINKIYINTQPRDEFKTVEYDGNNDPSNSPEIGYSYDPDRNIFIPPCPMEGYILDELTITWKPDPTRTYDLHNDGNLYRWNSENNTWIPTW